MIRRGMDDTMETGDGRFEPLLEELALLRRALAEREQELSCLQAIHELSRREAMSVVEQLQGMIDLVPFGFLERERMAVGATIDGRDFGTHGFAEMPEGHTTRIFAGEQEIGTLEMRCKAGPANDAPLSLQKRRFLVLVAARFGEVLERLVAANGQERRMQELKASEEENAALITRLRMAVQSLSVPILDVWDGVLLVPLFGVMDSCRAGEMSQKVLQAIVERQPYFVLLDMTGVEVIDTSTASYLLGIMRAISLLGVTCIFSGFQPYVAETILDLGIQMDSIIVRATLRDGLRECVRRMQRL